MLYILAFLVLNMTIVGVIFFRDQPESCGWIMEKGFAKDAQSQDSSIEFHTSLSAALKTMVFWLFNLGTTLHALIITAVVFHMSAIGREHGLDNAQAFALFLPMSISSTLSNLLAGYLSDRISIRYHLIVMQFSLAIGVVSCQSLDTWYGYGLTILGLGISGGVYVCLLGVAWPKFFGRRYLGEINGFNMGCVVFGSAFGPYLFSLIFDLFQSFSWALYLSAIPTIGIGLMTLLMPKAFAIETK
jgi:MFS family permease